MTAGWDSLSWEGKRGAVLHEASFVCEICGTAEATAVDHIWPRVLGGTDRRDNLRAACQPCNSTKGKSLWAEDVSANPSLAIDGINDAYSRAVRAINEMALWIIYRDAARFADPRAIDAAYAERREDRTARIRRMVIDLASDLAAEQGPVTGEHAAAMVVGSIVDMFADLTAEADDDDACPDDPDGLHHPTCGCDTSGVFA